jgi:hypothetical protein
MSEPLTRAQAHELIERCGGYREQLQTLARHWDVPGHWNDSITGEEWDAVLWEFVDERAVDGDHVRSYGPHDADLTDLTDCDLV